MTQAVQVDVREMVLSNAAFGPAEVKQLQEAIADDPPTFRALREAVGQLEQRPEMTPAMKVRAGVCNYLLGRFHRAAEQLGSADGGALARFYLAKVFMALEQFDKATEQYRAASKAGYANEDCAMGRAEAARYAGRHEEALKILDEISGPVEQTAEYLYQRGATVSVLGGSPDEVVRFYERAERADPKHPGALFGLAVENDRRGNDIEAMLLYQRATSRVRAHAGALMNLGLLHEDLGQYERAQQCYQRVLDVAPDHARARLYLKDAMASTEQVYDEDAQRTRDRMAQVLGVSVNDFELSVRSRNCLQRMGINSLGDLTKVTEPQLLASKNFGETSLVEIREMMHAKGLEIGMFASERTPIDLSGDAPALSADAQALLNKPVAELNLSVRARKCMIRLNIASIAELVRRTGDELLECKNFGVTSLNEVREKLAAHGLKLRGD
ncbi:MAG: tetratricopeptide repeat protein [Planctomycetia bacterium]|nr:tetratricopeptide repeat protein [Planctomycetia bacterium]